jgi:8-oxo-dGTP pyrophosphatase MutT (NUDIX family)
MSSSKNQEKKYYVCAFVFSYELDKVYLLRKERPEWQKGLLNGMGGLVEVKERPSAAMTREFSEECGVFVHDSQWMAIEDLENQNVFVRFFTTRLPKGTIPKTTTDEQVWGVFWKNYNHREWEELGVVANVPYLITKAHLTLSKKVEEQMKLQHEQT